MQPRYIEELPYADICQRFAPLAESPGAILLDSGPDEAGLGRYHIVSCEPTSTLTATMSPDGSILAEKDGRPIASSTFFDQLQQMPTALANNDFAGLPFVGGTMGYLGYDLGRLLEQLPCPTQRSGHLPLAWCGNYNWALVQDKLLHKAWLVATDADGWRLAQKKKQLIAGENYKIDNTFNLLHNFSSNYIKSEYINKVQQIKEYINAGDCYQVNLSQRFSAPYRGSTWQAYLALRQSLPATFSSYINTGQGELLSLSPERFMMVDHGKIETRPIKGTRRRGTTPHLDSALAYELERSSKDRAENLMIVDLLRNDLGRSCELGSIQVDELFKLESYANVHHLVSVISGHLTEGTSALEALCRAFPGGSITGAPKIRAMEVISELEDADRSAYCGSVFYASVNGRMDSNIAIRSLAADGENLYCWGGGGIVADSEPEAEYDESLAKVGILLNTLESMR